MRPLILVVIALAITSTRAQNVELIEALQPFAFMVGDWEGPAWHMDRTGQRQEIFQTEKVEVMGGGNVIVVQGTGYEGGPEGDRVFEAVGVISYDPDTGSYHLDAYNGGRHVRANIELVDGGFDWSFERAGRQFIYEMRHVDGQWIESGHMIFGDNEPMPFVGLTLDRVSETND